jgi:hypothetical protein
LTVTSLTNQSQRDVISTANRKDLTRFIINLERYFSIYFFIFNAHIPDSCKDIYSVCWCWLLSPFTLCRWTYGYIHTQGTSAKHTSHWAAGRTSILNFSASTFRKGKLNMSSGGSKFVWSFYIKLHSCFWMQCDFLVWSRSVLPFVWWPPLVCHRNSLRLASKRSKPDRRSSWFGGRFAT